jgi:hypothetical protein
MKNKIVLAVEILMIVVLMISCTGQKGEQGPTGPQGPEGPQLPGLYFIRLFQNGVYSAIYTGQVESCIFEGYSHSVYTNNTMAIKIGETDLGATYRALFRFDLSSLPNNKIIVDKAELTIKTNSNHYGDGARNIKIYKITSPWVVFQNGWYVSSNTSSWNIPGGDYDLNTITPQTATIDILPNSTITIELDTKVVQDWMEHPETNYGIIFIGANEFIKDNYAEIYPSGASEPSNRPMLKVCYYTVE